MAAKYRKIDPRIWDDEVFDTLDCHESLVVLWLLTSNVVNRCGIAVFSLGQLADKCRLQGVNEAWDTLSTGCNRLSWPLQKTSRNTVVVVLPNWFRYNAPTNADHLKGCISDLSDVPRCDVVSSSLERLRDGLSDAMKETWDTSLTGCRLSPGQGVPGVSPQKQEQKQERKQKEKRRQSPSFDPLKADIPSALRVEPFLEVWPLWCKHRAEIKKKLTETTVAQQLKELEAWGALRAVSAIRHTIARGWTGIREPENGQPAQRQQPREEELHGL